MPTPGQAFDETYPCKVTKVSTEYAHFEGGWVWVGGLEDEGGWGWGALLSCIEATKNFVTNTSIYLHCPFYSIHYLLTTDNDTFKSKKSRKYSATLNLLTDD